MAIYPKAIVKLLPENKTQRKIVPRKVVLHSAVSGADSLYGYFCRDSVVVESHFYVRNDGTVEQMMDTTVKADAQLAGNADSISIETEDNGNPDKNPWTDAQVKALVALIAWCCKTHGIPAVKVPAASGAGIGYHTQFVPEWAGDGRTCPGVARKPQVAGIITAVRSAVTPPPAPPRTGTGPVASRGPVRAVLPAFPGTVRRGDHGAAVRAVQARLKARGWRIAVDGSYGPATEAIVRQFQRNKKLKVDGIAGPQTWRALWLERIK